MVIWMGCWNVRADRRRRAGVAAPYGVRSSDMVRENRCRGAQRAPLQVYDQHHQKARRPLLHNEQRNNHQVSGASRGEGGRAAAAVCHKAIDGGTLSGHLLLCESYRRRVGCAKVGRALACRRSAQLGTLRGEQIRAVPPCGG